MKGIFLFKKLGIAFMAIALIAGFGISSASTAGAASGGLYNLWYTGGNLKGTLGYEGTQGGRFTLKYGASTKPQPWDARGAAAAVIAGGGYCVNEQVYRGANFKGNVVARATHGKGIARQPITLKGWDLTTDTKSYSSKVQIVRC